MGLGLPKEDKDLSHEDGDFWRALDALVANGELRIDRPRGSAHPRYRGTIYPLDYGELVGTRSGDGDPIDVWIGSLPERRVSAVVVTLDLAKRDSEIKVLAGCTPDEARTILAFHRDGAQSALLVERHG
jgi:inorganic pyrophosphatase